MSLEHLSEKDQELYCNRFAGAMLISKAKLIEEIGSEKRNKIFISELGQLKKQYGISISGLFLRLKDCGIISPTYCFDSLNEMKRQNIFKKEPAEYDFKGEENSNRFLQLLLRGVAMELISSSKAAALNNQKLSDFRKILK
jgi:Zn-dependent peptidase ImmA (M78 family)